MLSRSSSPIPNRKRKPQEACTIKTDPTQGKFLKFPNFLKQGEHFISMKTQQTF